jgi:gliding motility-associated-like protein
MTGNSFSMMAMYSSDAGFLSNQFMTPAGSSDGNYTNGVVDFAQAAPNPISVSAFLNNCCAFDTIDVDVSTPSLTVSSSNVTCNGQSNGTATVSVTGGSNPISFLWSNGASTASINGLNAGTYRVTVTANGCSASSTVTITQASAITLSSVSTNASCFGSNGSINLTVVGGTSPYTYAWSNGATSEDLTGLAVGSYTVNVRDASACGVQSTIVVNSNSATTVTVDSVTNVSCNGGNNGSINISAQAQPVPCSSPVIRINEVLTDVSGGLAAGDGSGCGNATNPLSAEFIELIGPPGANIGCFVLTDGDWTITIPQGTTIPSDGIFTIGNNNTPLHQGNGTVFDLNANACQCFTDSCQLLIFTNSGEYLAIFNSAGTFVDGLIYGTPSAANSPVAGTVIPTRGLAGCVNSVTLPPVASFATTAQPAEGNTISRIPDGNGAFTATPANTPNACNATAPPILTYQWSNGATTQDISGLPAGVYTVTVLDAQGCPTIRVATVTEPSAISLTASSVPVACFGGTNGTASVSASGGIAPYTFLWSNGSTASVQNNLAAGVYSVTSSDANSCRLINSITVTQASAISVTAVPLDIACSTSNIGGVNLSLSGGTASYSFQWSNGATSQNISGLSAGNYAVTISDANNCLSFASATVNSTPGLQVIATGTNLSCNGANDGCVQVFVNGGTAPYDYLWSNTSTLDSVCGLAAGTYIVIVTDNGATNCTGTDTITITAPAALVSNTVSITNGNCTTPGAINISVSGGTAPYSFVWSNGATSEDLSGLSAGTYSVTIIDANGCSIVNNSNTVNSSGQPQVLVNNSTNPTCNNSNDGTITLTVSGGTAPYSFVWSDGQTSQNLSALDGGNYSVTVSDALGCTATLAVSLNEPAAIQTTIITVQADCNDANASISVSASGGAGAPYSFVWQNASTTQDLTGLSSGNYSVTIEDANGCTLVESINIAAPLIPQLSAFIGQAGVSDSTIVIGEIIAVNAGADQSAQGVSYSWSSLPTSANFENDTIFATNVSPDPAGFYSLVITATSADGCISTDTLSLTVNPASDPKIPNAFSPNNDGTNDIFRVVDLNVQYLKEFKVYNRWGQLLYDNLQGSWDGTFNGSEQPREAYLYIISWQLPSDPNPVLIRGTVTLLR